MDDTEAMTNERLGYAAPGRETKGGRGGRAGPKRWTGRGPPPARHIPWPEIFKHHISLIEGHLKMTDMVRKHTVEGTGNHQTICAIIDRAKEMLGASRHISRIFVEPPNARSKVPVGSSSVSMYPGYSPADHIYGKAAEEYGKNASIMKQNGEELPRPENMEYHIGQGKGIKRRGSFDHGSPPKMLKGQHSGEGVSSDAAGTNNGDSNGATDDGGDIVMSDAGDVAKGNSLPNDAAGTSPSSDNPFFIIDTKPTPVKFGDFASTSAPGGKGESKNGRKDSSGSVAGDKHRTKDKKDKKNKQKDEVPKPDVKSISEEKPTKKHKKKHEGELPAAPSELQDISAEVEARLQEKRDKKEREKNKKRKRESEGTGPSGSNGADTVGQDPSQPEMKTKKKKSKPSSEAQDLVNRTVDKKPKTDEGSVDTLETKQGPGKKSKRPRKNKKTGGS